jgi:negative regulator of sigma E activity
MKNGEGSEGLMFGKDGSEKQCAAIESKLIVYLDGRAAPAERHAVEEHLSGCASCRTRAEEFRALSSVLDDVPAISPSPEFDATLRARIAAEPAPRNFWNWLPSPRLAFAVTALVVLSVWLSSGPRVITSPSVVNHAIQSIETSKVTAESDFGMIRDLPVLENYDVVSKFDALSELSGPTSASAQVGAKETR